MSELYIGVMSGTSLDGVDIALCEIDASSCKLLEASEHPFDETLKEEVLFTISNPTSLQKIGELDIKLGKLFADSIDRFLSEKNIQKDAVTAIGLHGQTLWHSPVGENAFSMQLGSANVVHAQTDIRTVADFRNMDIANGGQGAPFAPAFHQFLFHEHKNNTAVVNIGGMANITLLGEKLRGWDTGMGNVLMDFWIQETRHLLYDQEGEYARSGEINELLLENFLSDPYFKLAPPKSTGREYFNWEWLHSHIQKFKTTPHENIQRTLLELTAKTIANTLIQSGSTLAIICGGGSKNTFLLERIQKLSHIKIQTSDDYDVPSNHLEAMAFAWFAYKRIHSEPVNLSTVTGAKKNSILGAIYG